MAQPKAEERRTRRKTIKVVFNGPIYGGKSGIRELVRLISEAIRPRGGLKRKDPLDLLCERIRRRVAAKDAVLVARPHKVQTRGKDRKRWRN